MDYNRCTSAFVKYNVWSEWRKQYFYEQIEVAEERMSYNPRIYQSANMAIALESIQNR